MKKIFVIFLALAMMAGIIAGCDETTPAQTSVGTAATGTVATTASSANEYSTLILGSNEFSGVFSPFFGTSVYDMNVTRITQESLIRSTPDGIPTDGLEIGRASCRERV